MRQLWATYECAIGDFLFPRLARIVRARTWATIRLSQVSRFHGFIVSEWVRVRLRSSILAQTDPGSSAVDLRRRSRFFRTAPTQAKERLEWGTFSFHSAKERLECGDFLGDIIEFAGLGRSVFAGVLRIFARLGKVGVSVFQHGILIAMPKLALH